MKADVLALVDLLSNSTADPTIAATLYDDLVESWAPLGILTNAVRGSMNAGDATTDLPPNILSVLAFVWDSTQLGLLELRELEALDPGWRNRPGSPSSFTIDTINARRLALYPQPALPSGPDLGIFGEPLGRDYPVYSTVFIGAERRADVPPQYELPLALLILQREFSRESDHTDTDFAQLAGQMGAQLLSMAMGRIPA